MSLPKGGWCPLCWRAFILCPCVLTKARGRETVIPPRKPYGIKELPVKGGKRGKK